MGKEASCACWVCAGSRGQDNWDVWRRSGFWGKAAKNLVLDRVEYLAHPDGGAEKIQEGPEIDSSGDVRVEVGIPEGLGKHAFGGSGGSFVGG